jgi:flagellar basal body-associated protein FliL
MEHNSNIASKLQDLKINPPASTWSKIEQRKQNKRPKAKKSNLWMITSVAACFGFIAVMTVAFFMMKSNYEPSLMTLSDTNINSDLYSLAKRSQLIEAYKNLEPKSTSL